MDMNNLAISERTPVGREIYILKGSDPENGPVHFALEGTDVLQVNRNTGAVTVVKPLDYEVSERFLLRETHPCDSRPTPPLRSL